MLAPDILLDPASIPDDLREFFEPPALCGQCFVCHLVEVFREVWRVLRDDGTLWLNLGDSYAGSGKGTPGPNAMIAHLDRQGFVGEKVNAGKLTPGYKAKDLMEIPSMVAQALRADGWYLRSRIPWLKRNCLSGGTRVYVRSQKGEMPMSIKDLARLDPTTCQLWNGERWTQLMAMWETPRGAGDLIEIELRSGERIGCTPEHRWPTERGLLHAAQLAVGDVLTGTPLPLPGPDGWDTRRPDGLPDNDIGWFVGLYIAEGSMSNGTIQIASHTKETERLHRLEQIAEAFDGTCRAHLKGGNSMTINLTGPVLRGILEQYVGGRTAKDKHLTNRCWMRSNDFLRAVLDGYLSGDGHYDEQNKRWRLAFTRNYAWEADLRTIAARLDIDLRLKLATMPYAGYHVPIFRGSLRFTRTTKLWTKNEREVVRIGRSKGRKFWDIAVADEPHTFALASGVLTHNSMPESVTDRPATAVEYVFLLAKSSRYFFDADAVRVPQTDQWLKRTSGREVPRPPARLGGAEGKAEHTSKIYAASEGGRSRRNSDWFFESWQGLLLDEDDEPLALVVNPSPFKEAHFATFPTKLVEPMVKASTSERGVCSACGAPWARVVQTQGGSTGKSWHDHKDDLSVGHRDDVRTDLAWRNGDYQRTTGWQPTCTHAGDPVPATCLDPFSGAATTCLVADRLGRNAIGIDLKPTYAEMGTNRIQQEAPLFHDVPVMPKTPPTQDKQGELGKRTYTGFNARWDAKEKNSA